MLERGHGHDHAHAHERVDENDEWTGPTWTEKELKSYIERNGACVLVLEGYAVDVTRYMKIHVRLLSYFPFMFFFPASNLATDGLLAAWRYGAAA
jgi:hypothetical protein